MYIDHSQLDDDPLPFIPVMLMQYNISVYDSKW